MARRVESGAIAFRISADAFGKYEYKLKEMVRRLRDRSAFYEEAAAYMVRSTQNRILRQKRDLKGNPWAGLSDVTIRLKGSTSILFASGTLARGISIDKLGPGGFTIKAEAKNDRGEDYAHLMQSGVRRQGGFVRTRRRGMFVPARPFLGFSPANIKQISKMLREHIMGENMEEGMSVE